MSTDSEGTSLLEVLPQFKTRMRKGASNCTVSNVHGHGQACTQMQEYKFSFDYGNSGAVTMNLSAPNQKKKTTANVPLVRCNLCATCKHRYDLGLYTTADLLQ